MGTGMLQCQMKKKPHSVSSDGYHGMIPMAQMTCKTYTLKEYHIYVLHQFNYLCYFVGFGMKNRHACMDLYVIYRPTLYI